MITIKQIDENNAELIVDKGTSGMTIMLGLELLVEVAIKHTGMNIDDVLRDIKNIYEKDNEVGNDL